jgi:tRNA modification GTPase
VIANDTIAAIATAHGRGGIGVVRVSGPHARAIFAALTRRAARDRSAQPVRFLDAADQAIDHGLALYFRAPRSYTGEDVVELHAHGNPVVLEALVARCVELGARRARAGEFTERAFLNGKLDLAQAEAVADLIASGSAAQARAAQRSLAGEFSRRIDALAQTLTRLRVWVEAALDFPEEEIDFLADARLRAELDAARAALAEVVREARRGQRLTDGLHVVILGAPNAGKSSLLNALAGDERAIVTPIAGTTRDLLREAVQVDGVELTLVDTAGLRDTADVVEAEGVRRARAEIARADLALLLIDASRPPAQQVTDRAALDREVPATVARLWLHTKSDLQPSESTVGAASAATGSKLGDTTVAADAAHTAPSCDSTDHGFGISARTGAGLDALRAELARRAGGDADGAFSARARHVDALQRAATHLDAGLAVLAATNAGELLAEELRQTQHALGEITGTTTADDLLGAIFSSFCIGK